MRFISIITMAVEGIKDYETEFDNFDQKVSLNCNTFQKILSTTLGHINVTIQHELDLACKTKSEVAEMQKKIENIRQDVNSVRMDKDRAGRERQKLKQDYDQLNMVISKKAHEKDELKEMLMQHEQQLREKEQQIEYDELKHQEKLSNIEKGMLLYQTHLGLRIQRTKHNSLVFVFTQVNRSDPSREYLLELTVEGDSYHLKSSDPPLSNLHELEERLNASNNLSGCIFHIRKLFQEMEG